MWEIRCFFVDRGWGLFVRVGAQGVRGWLMVGTGMLWFFSSEVLGFLVLWFFVLLA